MSGFGVQKDVVEQEKVVRLEFLFAASLGVIVSFHFQVAFKKQCSSWFVE